LVFVFRFRAARQSVFYSCAREGVFAFGRFPGETVGLIARSLVFNRRSERRAGFSTGHARWTVGASRVTARLRLASEEAFARAW